MLFSVTLGDNVLQVDVDQINSLLEALPQIKDFKIFFDKTWFVEADVNDQSHLLDLINPYVDGKRQFCCSIHYVAYHSGWGQQAAWDLYQKFYVNPNFERKVDKAKEVVDGEIKIDNAAGYQDERYKIDYSHKILDEKVEIKDLLLDDDVISSIEKLLGRSIFLQHAKASGFNIEPGFDNILFSGPQGVGKSTLAKAVALHYARSHGKPDMPIYFVEAKDLIARYTGQAANNVNQLLYQARDGIVIFDEIDSILHDEIWYGSEILNAFNAHMGNSKNRPVIFATLYESQVENLFLKNRGLKKRFGRHFHMEGPKNEKLLKIFEDSIKKTGLPYDADIIKEAAFLLEQLKKSSKRNFAYIRDVKSIEDVVFESLAERYAKTQTFDGLRITLSDMPIKDDLGELTSRPAIKNETEIGSSVLPFRQPQQP